MSPEARDYLDKAREDLDEARKIAAIGLAKAAARSAYYAAFHAAEALIVERTGKIARTHAGVRAMFADLSRFIPELDRAHTSFLAQAYKYKEIGDYGVGRGSAITQVDAEDAIKSAERFVDAVQATL